VLKRVENLTINFLLFVRLRKWSDGLVHKDSAHRYAWDWVSWYIVIS